MCMYCKIVMSRAPNATLQRTSDANPSLEPTAQIPQHTPHSTLPPRPIRLLLQHLFSPLLALLHQRPSLCLSRLRMDIAPPRTASPDTALAVLTRPRLTALARRREITSRLADETGHLESGERTTAR